METRARRHAAASAGALSGDVIIKRHPGGGSGRQAPPVTVNREEGRAGRRAASYYGTTLGAALLRSPRGETSGGQSTPTAGLRTHCMIRLHHRLPLTAE